MLEMCGLAGHWLRLAIMFSNSFRKIIHKLKAELMNYMCYHLSFMSETEPYKVDTLNLDFLKCTVDAMWRLSS